MISNENRSDISDKGFITAVQYVIPEINKKPKRSISFPPQTDKDQVEKFLSPHFRAESCQPAAHLSNFSPKQPTNVHVVKESVCEAVARILELTNTKISSRSPSRVYFKHADKDRQLIDKSKEFKRSISSPSHSSPRNLLSLASTANISPLVGCVLYSGCFMWCFAVMLQGPIKKIYSEVYFIVSWCFSTISQ